MINSVSNIFVTFLNMSWAFFYYSNADIFIFRMDDILYE